MRLPAVTALVASGAVLCTASTAAAQTLTWARHPPWVVHRWLGTHLLHGGVGHLVPDLVAFVCLGALLERWAPRRAGIAAVLAAIVIPAVLLIHPDVASYQGLSGIDAALAATLVGVLFREGHRRIAIACATAMTAKLAWELVGMGPVFASGADGLVHLPWPHLVGGLCGTVAARLPIGRGDPTTTARPANAGRAVG